MENASQCTLYHSLALADPVFFFYDIIFTWISILQKYSLRFLSSFLSYVVFPLCTSRIYIEKNTSSNVARGDLELTAEDLETVMEKMGMFCGREGEQLKERLAFNELHTMFEEKDPSLDEVKGAFSVFDENCDGFIDAMELQRVLSKLGFREGVALVACQQMIAAQDENQDGRIDFNEFVKLMESSFC